MLWFVNYVLNLEYCPKTKEVALFMLEFVFKLPATYGLKHQKTATYLAVSMDIQNCALETWCILPFIILLHIIYILGL